MPYIRIATAKSLSELQQDTLKQELGSAISSIPGKTEAVTMIEISLGQTIYFRGARETSSAFVEIKLFRKTTREAKEAFAVQVFFILEKVAGIIPEDVYLNFQECDNWGLKGILKFDS